MVLRDKNASSPPLYVDFDITEELKRRKKQNIDNIKLHKEYRNKKLSLMKSQLYNEMYHYFFTWKKDIKKLRKFMIRNTVEEFDKFLKDTEDTNKNFELRNRIQTSVQFLIADHKFKSRSDVWAIISILEINNLVFNYEKSNWKAYELGDKKDNCPVLENPKDFKRDYLLGIRNKFKNKVEDKFPSGDNHTYYIKCEEKDGFCFIYFRTQTDGDLTKTGRKRKTPVRAVSNVTLFAWKPENHYLFTANAEPRYEILKVLVGVLGYKKVEYKALQGKNLNFIYTSSNFNTIDDVQRLHTQIIDQRKENDPNTKTKHDEKVELIAQLFELGGCGVSSTTIISKEQILSLESERSIEVEIALKFMAIDKSKKVGLNKLFANLYREGAMKNPLPYLFMLMDGNNQMEL